MTPCAAIAHLPIAKRQPAKGDEHFTMLGDVGPACMLGQQSAKTAKNMRHDHLGSGIAIGVHRSCVAANDVQETMDLALCVMKSASTCPAIGPGIDGAVAICRTHPVKLRCHKSLCFVPADLDKRVTATRAVRRTRPVIEPAAAHRWAPDPSWMVEKLGKRRADWRRVTILGKGRQASHTSVRDSNLVGSPMRTRQRHSRLPEAIRP